MARDTVQSMLSARIWRSLRNAASAVVLLAASAFAAASPVTADLSNTGPGSLVEAKVLTNIDASISSLGATAVRVLYRSTSGRDGKPTVVSGIVFVPAGTPPPGGWPVLAQAHGTIGIDNECGPSLYPNLLGTAPMMAQFLKAGFAVAAADYEGLGAPGIHLYLDAKTEAWNVIDSVRALRHVQGSSISDRWLVFGGSQGGAAAWAAAEQASIYAPELRLLGAVAFVPPTDFSEYAQKALDGSFNPHQAAAYIAMLATQSRVHPELDLDLYRRGSVAKNWQALLYCLPARQQERGEALKQIKMDELKPATPQAVSTLRNLLAKMALPERRAQAPLLVIYAGKDQFIDPEWTRAAIVKACAMGTKIQAVYQADKDHGADWSMVPAWLQERLDGKPFHDTCQK